MAPGLGELTAGARGLVGTGRDGKWSSDRLKSLVPGPRPFFRLGTASTSSDFAGQRPATVFGLRIARLAMLAPMHYAPRLVVGC